MQKTRIMNYLHEDRVISELQGTDKLSVVEELSRVLMKSCQVASYEEIVRVILDREKLQSTGIGDGIALPHGRLKGLKDFVLSFGRSSKGVDFDSSDHKPTHLFFIVVAPENLAANNLGLLSRIVTLLKNTSFRKRLMEARSREELFQRISEEDEKY